MWFQMSVHYINAAGVQIPQSDFEIIIEIRVRRAMLRKVARDVVVDDVPGDLWQVPLDGFLGVVLTPVAVFKFVVDHCGGLAFGIAEREGKSAGVVVIDQGEEFQSFQNARFVAVFWLPLTLVTRLDWPEPIRSATSESRRPLCRHISMMFASFSGF